MCFWSFFKKLSNVAGVFQLSYICLGPAPMNLKFMRKNVAYTYLHEEVSFHVYMRGCMKQSSHVHVGFMNVGLMHI